MALLRRNILATGLILVSATSVAAQQPAAPSCDVGSAAKGSLALASLNVERARAAGTGAAAESNLKSTVKALESAKR